MKIRDYIVTAEYRDAPKRQFGPTRDPEAILLALAGRADVIGAAVALAPGGEIATPEADGDPEDMSIGDAIRKVNAERADELDRLRSIALERGWEMRPALSMGMVTHHDWWSEDKRCAWFDDEVRGWRADGRLGIVVLNHERAALTYALGLA